MSDLIDAACDICGRQYRWPDERLGETATCRYCGTKFEVKVFVAPEEDSHAKDLQWFKGVGVAILVLAVVVGLSSLLVIRPSATGWTMAGDSWRFPRFGLPTGSPSREAQRRLDEARESEMQFQRDRALSRIAGMPTPMLVRTYPTTGKLFSSSSPFTKISPTANTGHLATSAPVVTEWGFVGEPPHRKLQLKGTGLQGLTKFQFRFGSGLTDGKCSQVSDSLLETDGFFVSSREVTMYVITNPHGIAVVFSDDIATVDTLQTLPRQPAKDVPNLYFVQNGGQLLSEYSVSVIIEDGGRATVNPWLQTAIVKRGGELKTGMEGSAILEVGAKLTAERPALNDLAKTISVPAITFCRLPVIDKK